MPTTATAAQGFPTEHRRTVGDNGQDRRIVDAGVYGPRAFAH